MLFRSLLALSDTHVTFQWKDYRQPHHLKRMSLTGEEFIRRFLLHALPPGLQRIRYYGLLANCRRKLSLARCRQLLHAPAAELLPQPNDYRDLYQQLTARSLTRCPRCLTGVMVRIGPLPVYRWPALPPDTS